MNITETLTAAAKNGEILIVKYHGGSQSGALREILPISVEKEKITAKCLTSGISKNFFIEKIEIMHDGEDCTYVVLPKKKKKKHFNSEININVSETVKNVYHAHVLQKIHDKWYLRKWFIILASIIFPPAGLTLMWFGKCFSKTTRIVVTLLYVVYLIAKYEAKSF